MKSEKIIKNHLNEAVSDIDPDILGNILQSERITDNLENDLRDEPLFMEEVNHNKKWVPAGVFACVFSILIFAVVFMMPTLQKAPTQQLATITFDINPSMDMQVDEKGKIVGAVANNKDAEVIVSKINKKLEKEMSNDEILKYAATQLEKAGYLKGKKAVMLVSSEKTGNNSSKNLKEMKNIITNYKKDNEKKFVAVYQEYEITEEVEKVAKKNNVSTAKAAYCLKVSKKTEAKVDDICKDSISEVTSQLVNVSSGYEFDDEIEMDEDVVEFIGGESEDDNEEDKKDSDKVSNSDDDDRKDSLDEEESDEEKTDEDESEDFEEDDDVNDDENEGESDNKNSDDTAVFEPDTEDTTDDEQGGVFKSDEGPQFSEIVTVNENETVANAE